MAESTVEPVILPKSGLNKNSSPFAAFGNVSPLITTTIKQTNKAGIRILLAFSMPLFTPKSTIMPTTKANTSRYTTGIPTLVVNVPNISPTLFAPLATPIPPI